MGARKSVSITVLPGSTVELINKELVNKLVNKFSPEIVHKTDEENAEGKLFQFNKKIRLIVEYRGDEDIPSKRPAKGTSTKEAKPKTVAKEKTATLTENTPFNLDILAKIKGEIQDENKPEAEAENESPVQEEETTAQVATTEEEQAEVVEG